jgi:hypothetical protein
VADSSTLQGEPLLPEAGVLSNQVYTSRFFGFSLTLPLPLAGHRILLPPLPSGQYALLGMGFQQGSHSGTFVITAGSHVQIGRSETAQEKQEDLQRWAQGKPPQVSMEPPDWMQRSGQMKHVQKHVRDLYGVQYWTRIKNYTIRFTVETNDPAFLKRSKQAVHDIRFYCPEDDGTLVQPDGNILKPEGEPYEGPSVPTDRIDAAIEAQPAEETIPAGQVTAGVYHNSALGLQYDIPSGWQVIEPAGLDDSKPPRILDLLQACSKTLLRAVPQSPAGGPTATGEGLMLRAIDQACLPLPMPVDEQDQLRAESLGEYLSMLGLTGSVNSRRLVTASGRLFAVFSGTLADEKKTDALPRRELSTTVVTRYRKLLLIWLWSALSPERQQSIPCTKAVFGDEPALQLCPGLASAVTAQVTSQ